MRGLPGKREEQSGTTGYFGKPAVNTDDKLPQGFVDAVHSSFNSKKQQTGQEAFCFEFIPICGRYGAAFGELVMEDPTACLS